MKRALPQLYASVAGYPVIEGSDPDRSTHAIALFAPDGSIRGYHLCPHKS